MRPHRRSSTTTGRKLALAAALGSLAACTGSPAATDLLRARDVLVDASAAGQPRAAVLTAGERGLRINDVLVRGFAAGPPSRLAFRVDIPRDGRLQLLCAIDPRYH